MLHTILPILIGGIIGYCTNYIAIKMLFRPRRPVYIGKWKLPFTPGVIPKNQKRIAGAVGNAVSDQLITKEDLAEQLRKSGVKDQLVTAVTEKIAEAQKDSETVGKVAKHLSGSIVREMEQTDFVPAIREIGNQALQEYLQNPMIAMFLGGSVLEGAYVKIDAGIKDYVSVHGEEIVEGFLLSHEIEKDTIGELTGLILDAFIVEKGMNLLDSLDVRGVVTGKIEAMDVKELEALVMYVMENELKAVINLGAVIGALIGIVNVFI